MATRDIFTALEVPDFRWLWIGSLGSSFAMNMQIVARGWLVYTLTSSALDLAWVTLSFMVPQVAFSLWGGVVADRVRKKRIIIIAQTLNCIATLILGVIVFTDRVEFWDFIWFGFFNGTVLAMSMPARQAFVPELIPEKLIFTAMALNTTCWNLSRIIGPSVAGGLIAVLAQGDTSSTYGVGIVYFVIAVLYFLSAITMGLVSQQGQIKPDNGQSALGDVGEAMRYVWENPPVFGLILLSIVPFLFGMPLNTLLPAFTEDILGGQADDLGFLMSCMGVGAIVGSLMLAAMGGLRNKGAWIVASCVGWGAFTVAFGFTETLWFACAMIVLIGWISAWNMSLNRGLLQLQIDPNMRGRVLAIDMMSHGLMPIGVIPISLIAEIYDVAVALMVAGGIFVVVILLLLAVSVSVRAIDRYPPPLEQ
ncbi:MAG: MFS transporter [Pseudomonadales bacterium]|jgi:sugar phosphate permease|nr:MFS transporter [Pseudomonadales bacterium]MDP6471011.1 MFS transporter [Pseudomonadales bacterium]MDP6825803.1 MFS transporter [Pseudomonadales bacterium]MDP6970203.1 MFS transporter [Pseudomonadales bacterium]